MSRPNAAYSAYRDMTLGQAVKVASVPPPGCACVGPWPPPCYCVQRDIQVAALKRAAHIVVRQLADLAVRKVRP